MELLIVAPKYVRNNKLGLSFLNETLFKIQFHEYTRLVLNFKKTNWFEANLVAILGVCIKEAQLRRKEVVISNLSSSIKNVFKKNGFYTYFNLGEEEDTFNSTIQFKVFNVYSLDDFADYISSEVIPKIKMELNDSIRKSLTASLNELFVNVSLHAKSREVITCGQYYHTHQKVAFTIVDKGITIPQNYKNIYGDNLHDFEAVKWATIYGNTTRADSSVGGLGLHIIDDFIQRNNGIFQIMSGCGYWERNGSNIINEELQCEFPGTIVNIITKLESTGFKYHSDILF